MKRVDLHEEFVKTLLKKVPKRSELVNRISDILLIERESASRRLSGRVLFSVREIGILAEELKISLDRLNNNDNKYLWLLQLFSSPMKVKSLDTLSDLIENNLNQAILMHEGPSEGGCIYNSLPVEFFIHYPALMKFMFFKWGHYFVGTEEFYNFSKWTVPPRLEKLKDKYKELPTFNNLFYIWDNSLIWNLLWEIKNFHKMHVITTEDKDLIKKELKELLIKLENFLKGFYSPDIPQGPRPDFYVSNISLGFTSSYHASENYFLAIFQTTFSYALVDDYESFCQLRDWVKSIRNMSILFSDSAPIERRLFFESQHKLIDETLD